MIYKTTKGQRLHSTAVQMLSAADEGAFEEGYIHKELYMSYTDFKAIAHYLDRLADKAEDEEQ